MGPDHLVAATFATFYDQHRQRLVAALTASGPPGSVGVATSLSGTPGTGHR